MATTCENDHSIGNVGFQPGMRESKGNMPHGSYHSLCPRFTRECGPWRAADRSGAGLHASRSKAGIGIVCGAGGRYPRASSSLRGSGFVVLIPRAPTASRGSIAAVRLNSQAGNSSKTVFGPNSTRGPRPMSSDISEFHRPTGCAVDRSGMDIDRAIGVSLWRATTEAGLTAGRTIGPAGA